MGKFRAQGVHQTGQQSPNHLKLRKKTLRMKELKSSVGLGGKPGDGGEEVNKNFKDAIIGSLTSLSYVSTSIV